MVIVYFQAPLIYNSFKQENKVIKPVTLIDLQNNIVDFPVDGKQVYLFWATWCGPCHLQMSYLELTLSESQLTSIVAISLGENPKTVNKFLKKNPLSFKVLIAPSSDSWQHFGVKATPSTMFLNKDGRVDYFSSGLSFLFPLRVWFLNLL